ncbi:unnamed protein product, partial [Choristocarpus tenellus]
KFVRGVCDHDDPMSVLYSLSMPKDPFLLRSVLAFANTALEDVLVKFLRWLGQDVLSRGTSCHAQQKVLLELWRTPGLADTMLDGIRCDDISDEMTIIWFIGRLLLDLGEAGTEARSSDTLINITKRLTRSLSPIVRTKAEELFRVITGPVENMTREQQVKSGGLNIVGASGVEMHGGSLEATRESLPGGRHDNDSIDFRSVSIVPSLEELRCTKRPFLPTPSDDWPHLDRQFRLLRHDMVSSIKDAIEGLPNQGRGNAKSRGGRPPLILRRVKRGAVTQTRQGRKVLMMHFDWPMDHR